MPQKTIFSIGLELPDIDGFEVFDIISDQSLLDADIVIIRPNIDIYKRNSVQTYNGKPLLSERSSFLLKEKIDHWSSQIRIAFDNGKTIVVFLPSKDEVFRYTGEKTYSGTGRSRSSTDIVASASNFDFIPLNLGEVIYGQGRSMKLSDGSEILASYWKYFSDSSVYEINFKTKCKPLILTKSGDMVVGGLFSGKGNVLCLPNIEWDADTFVDEDSDEWTTAAETFTYNLRDQIFGIDAALRLSGGATPEPEWAKADAFRFAIEGSIETEILKLGQDIEELGKLREEKRQSLRESGSLRALLFEKGKPLEVAVRDALKILGFDVSHFKEADSEFDAVFESSEGRFLGEVEGKDSKPINVDKYSQLERNINEDLSKDDVKEPAKGVLFGNAYRLTSPDSREAFFTDKVLTAARRTGCALVRTPDLFVVVRYLKETKDDTFAMRCRTAIMSSAGTVVVFPTTPEAEANKISDK